MLSHQVIAAAANTEKLLQVGELGLALGLSLIMGLERELRQKSAGLRTHTLVGVGAGLFMLISKYGFSDVLEPGRIIVDPSRVAAQIVTGIGFLGAGLIFVRRDSVRGLTTAAGIWVTAAVGAAAGAGLPVLACLGTAIYLLIALAFPVVTRRLPSSGTAISAIRVQYPVGRGILRELLDLATNRGFAVDDLSTSEVSRGDISWDQPAPGDRGRVEVILHVHGRGSVTELAAALSELDGVHAVIATDVNAAAR